MLISPSNFLVWRRNKQAKNRLQYLFFNCHPLQVIFIFHYKVKNCDSDSRFVVDEDDNGKFGLERVDLLSVTIVVFNLFF